MSETELRKEYLKEFAFGENLEGPLIWKNKDCDPYSTFQWFLSKLTAKQKEVDKFRLAHKENAEKYSEALAEITSLTERLKAADIIVSDYESSLENLTGGELYIRKQRIARYKNLPLSPDTKS